MENEKLKACLNLTRRLPPNNIPMNIAGKETIEKRIQII
jgi:hypothetical protein